MNYMKQVAEMLGVEMGERFNISGWNESTKFYITEEGLMREGFTAPRRKAFDKLLTGEAEIIKEPWKPKEGEEYYFVGVNEKILHTNFEVTMDYAMLLMGNCFRTPKDAKAHKDEVMAKFKAVME